jgi:hypothetical protein
MKFAVKQLKKTPQVRARVQNRKMDENIFMFIFCRYNKPLIVVEMAPYVLFDRWEDSSDP